MRPPDAMNQAQQRPVAGEGLAEPPPGWVQLTADNKDDGLAVKWAGQGRPPPPLGAPVTVLMNGLGPGVVVGYFVEHGYLGLHVRCHQLPEWMLAQRKRHGLDADTPARVFATEIRW